MTDPFTPQVWIREDTVIIAHRFGGCYEQIRVGNTGLDDPEEISVLPSGAVPLVRDWLSYAPTPEQEVRVEFDDE